MSFIRLLATHGLLLLLIGYSELSRSETLKIAADEWCPVNCEEGSERPGIFVELARDIFAEFGIRVEYQTMNWARTLQLVRRGGLNGAIGAGVEDAPDFLFHDVPMAMSRNCFYTRLDSTWTWGGVNSLDGQTLGVINDYSYGDILNTYISAYRNDASRVQLASGDRALALSLGKLQRKRLDVVLENPWVVEAMLAKKGRAGTVREAGCRSPDVPIYIAFSPVLESSVRYAKIFDEGIKRFRADGRLKALFDAYGVTEH
ncbi:substrate-binding periplasmic protein [Pseudomonas sp. TTU2014-080ASC]|uniref:substrate-binding periplasmic protein n=1 Tax=Pseudomonas sp. TTU2014-080ASC TaxID=1729724 RepID=UPI0009E930CB|nr:transporter substrate-binding domain-containing protein [Pseudomonas sp. TTU2014-080ASC]